MNTVIAQHLNVSAAAVTRIEEWANVIFCVVKGLGARFVSKKVVKVKMTPAEKFTEIANRVVSEIGRGEVMPHKSRPSVSFYPLGMVTFHKGEPCIRDCWDEARFMIQELWDKEGFENNQPEKKEEPREEWFFGAADEESF